MADSTGTSCAGRSRGRAFRGAAWSAAAIAALFAPAGAGASAGFAAAPRSDAPTARARAVPRGGVTFEANRGQTDPSVAFVARGRSYTAFLRPDAAVFALRAPRDPAAAPPLRNSDRKPVATHAVRMEFAGARARTADGASPLVTRSHHFRGSDPAKWVTDVPHFGAVEVDGLWEGVDLVWRGDRGGLEYEFRVGPGADPARIALAFRGADETTVDARGDLVLRVPGGEVRHSRPVAWQVAPDGRRPVEARFALRGGTVGFDLGALDPALPLVIDPVVNYATLFGAEGSDQTNSLAVDPAGNAYVAGATNSATYPSTAGAQPAPGGGSFDGWVAKLDPDGANLLWVSYLGGSEQDLVTGVAVDGSGHACVTGYTQSADFPVANARTATAPGDPDAFVARLAPDGGSFVYSTYFGTPSSENNHLPSGGIAADADGNVVFVGSSGPDFEEDVFVRRFDPTGANITFSANLGGTGQDVACAVAIGPGGTIYVAARVGAGDAPAQGGAQPASGGQSDAYVVKYDPALSPGSQRVYATYVGGSFPDEARSVAVDAAGAAYVTGVTYSTNFPTTAGALRTTFGQGNADAFVTKIAPDGASFAYSTYLGGRGEEQTAGAYTGRIAVEAGGVAHVVGTTTSATDFPLVDAGQDFIAGLQDAFYVRLNSAGSAVLFSTFVGGSHGESCAGVGLDAGGNVYLAGFTVLGIGTTGGAYQSESTPGGDTYVVKNPAGYIPVPPPPPPPPPTTVASYFLPKTVRVIVNARDPSKSGLNAAGIFDTGPEPPDLTRPATLDLGGLSIAIPSLAPKGKTFVYSGQGLSFTMIPNPLGSSRAKFKLRYTGDVAGKVPADGPVEFRFANGVVTGTCNVELARGLFGLGRVRGSLVDPNLHVQRATAVLKGDGKDALLVLVGLATDGVTPEAASDLTIEFGPGLRTTIPAADFVRKGASDVFRGNRDGLTSVVVDYARERITVVGRGLSLGSFEEGGNPVDITVGVGQARRTVRVRLGRKGAVMKY